MKKALLTIFLIVFVDLLGFGIVIPILPYYAKYFGASAWTLGWLMAIYSLLQFVCAPLWGRLSDHIGRKPVLMVSIVTTVVSMIMMGYARSIVWLFAARALAGLGGANISTAYAYICDVTPEKDRAKGMGIIGAGFGLGFVFGPAIGGWLSQYGYSTPMFFAAGLAFVNFFLVWTLLKEARMGFKERASHREKKFDWDVTVSVLNNAKRRYSIGTFFLLTLAVTQMEVSFALYMNHYFNYDARHAGMLLAVMGLVMALVQGGLIGRLAKKYGESNLVLFGLVVATGGLFLFGSVLSLHWVVVALLLLAFGHGVSHPSLSSLTSKASAASQQGATMGVFQSAGSLARVVGPPCAGYLYDRVSPGAPFYCGAVVLAVGFLNSVRVRTQR